MEQKGEKAKSRKEIGFWRRKGKDGELNEGKK